MSMLCSNAWLWLAAEVGLSFMQPQREERTQQQQQRQREAGTAEASEQEQQRATLLVVDSASFVGAAAMVAAGGHGQGGDVSSSGQALLAALGRALKGIAQRFGMAVLTTNHLVGGKQCQAAGRLGQP